MTIIYCYDVYCGWCYGFSPVISRIAEEYKNEFNFEVLSGGMILPEQPQPIATIAPLLRNICHEVQEKTEIAFGADFLFHINRPDDSDWFPNSEKAAIALCIFKELFPRQGVHFAAELQYALNFEGRDMTDDEAFRHLLHKFDIDPDIFYAKLHADAYKEKAYNEFATVKQLKVDSFPQLLLQVSENKFYLLAKGYTPYETLKNTFDSILIQIKSIQN